MMVSVVQERNLGVATGGTGVLGLLYPFVWLADIIAGVLEDKTESEEKEKEKVSADAKVTTSNQHSVYYGADRVGDLTGKKEWRIRTGPMDYETAIAWTITTAASGQYGKNASWGLYTTNQHNAYQMAIALGGVGPCLHENRLNEYPHYHVNGMLLFSEYKHFHIWYGDMYMG